MGLPGTSLPKLHGVVSAVNVVPACFGNLLIMGHIFVGEKPDFYEIEDDLPKFAGSSNGELAGDYK